MVNSKWLVLMAQVWLKFKPFTIHHLLPERHSQTLQKRARLFIIASAGDYCDVHPTQFVDFVEVDLRENQLLADPNGVVSTTIKRLGRDATEIPYTWQRNRNKSIEEFIHPLTAKRNHDPD